MLSEKYFSKCFFENKQEFLENINIYKLKFSRGKIFKIKINGTDKKINFIKERLKGFVLDMFYGKNVIYLNNGIYYIFFEKNEDIRLDKFFKIKSELEKNSYININIESISIKDFQESIK